MDMVRILTIAFAAAGLAVAADFSIQIGNPVAAFAANTVNPQKVKAAVMAVRAQGCADPAKARFTGTATRMNGTSRESAALGFIEGATPGSFTVVGGWAGSWLAVITGDCQGSKAGALVPVNAQGSYVREASQFFNHAPTDAEMETMMKTVMGGLR